MDYLAEIARSVRGREIGQNDARVRPVRRREEAAQYLPGLEPRAGCGGSERHRVLPGQAVELRCEREAMRRHLTDHYAEPIERVRSRSEEVPHHRALWSGIQRFLFEDRVGVDTGKSRTQLRKECGVAAHEVIQRSNAWTRVIAECFPTALRLSIHPQPAHSSKIGIHLMEVDDDWLTPWHGVAIETTGGWRLLPRHEAERLGGRIVAIDGKPSHYALEERTQ